MVRLEFAKGIKEFNKAINILFKPNTKLIAYFVAEKNNDGISWCPDCNAAEPIVNEAIKKFANKDFTFLTVDVGNKKQWKDNTNPFRVDPSINLRVIPTLIRWKTVHRLENEECKKMDLLEMFFKEL